MDQAEHLRALMRAQHGRARHIAVTSGKGGVGKTNVAVNLALALAELGQRVVLVDLDFGLANADILLGAAPRIHLGHVLSGEVSPCEALTSSAGGVWLLAGSPGRGSLSDLEASDREFLRRCFQDLESHADIILADTAAGISRNVIHFAASAQEVLVVVTPEPTSIADGYAAIKAIAREKGLARPRIVVNWAADAAEATRVHERIHRVAKKFLGLEVECLGFIPEDDAVRSAVRRRSALLQSYPDAPASKALRAMARRLLAIADDGSGRLKDSSKGVLGVAPGGVP